MSNKDYDSDLNPVLAKATNEDLDIIVQYILKASITQALSKSTSYKKHKDNHQKYTNEIANEIRLFGSNTIASLVRRGKGVCYLEVVKDVADKIGASYSKNASIELVEEAILLKFLEKAWEKMSDDDKSDLLKQVGATTDALTNISKVFPVAMLQILSRNSGFAAYQTSVIIADAIAKFILGRGLIFTAGTTLTRVISIVTGPVGWAVTVLWTAKDIVGAAYRVTIPCVVHIAMLRRKFNLAQCPKCSTQYSGRPKFCPECGEKLDKEMETNLLKQ
jgi:uncharacterized protein YaaW (UPF0174 family)